MQDSRVSVLLDKMVQLKDISQDNSTSVLDRHVLLSKKVESNLCVCVCVCVRACNKLSFSFNTSELVTTEIFSKEAKQLLNENMGDLGA